MQTADIAWQIDAGDLATSTNQELLLSERLGACHPHDAGDAVATHILAPCFASLAKAYPEITIELFPDSQDLSLAMREADIAVRLTRPNQHDIIIRRIGKMKFGLYASQSYLDAHGEIDFATGCSGHFTILQLDGIQDAAQTDWLAEMAPRARTAMQTTSHGAAVNIAVNGGGLACLARFRPTWSPVSCGSTADAGARYQSLIVTALSKAP